MNIRGCISDSVKKQPNSYRNFKIQDDASPGSVNRLVLNKEKGSGREGIFRVPFDSRRSSRDYCKN